MAQHSAHCRLQLQQEGAEQLLLLAMLAAAPPCPSPQRNTPQALMGQTAQGLTGGPGCAARNGWQEEEQEVSRYVHESQQLHEALKALYDVVMVPIDGAYGAWSEAGAGSVDSGARSSGDVQVGGSSGGGMAGSGGGETEATDRKSGAAGRESRETAGSSDGAEDIAGSSGDVRGVVGSSGGGVPGSVRVNDGRGTKAFRHDTGEGLGLENSNRNGNGNGIYSSAGSGTGNAIGRSIGDSTGDRSGNGGGGASVAQPTLTTTGATSMLSYPVLGACSTGEGDVPGWGCNSSCA